MKRIFILLVAFVAFGCTGNKFITVEEGQFIRNGKPYYYVGTNFWYGAQLGSQGEGGNRERLSAELDSMKAIGIDNLRILVGADGANGVFTKVEPTLQTEPGVYNDEIFDGLDWLLKEMAARDMVAVLYLNNAWEWSGGYSQYIAWATGVAAPIPNVDGWEAYSEYVKQYVNNAKAKEMAADNVRHIISRTNRYTGVKYTDDPTIMSWQIANEPRAFSDENKEPFAQWILETAQLIKSLDKNHLVSTGNEGRWGCEGDLALWERIHSYPEVDYATIHIWPYNWNWTSAETTAEELVVAISNTDIYIDEHVEICTRIAKPLVIEEFGYLRDKMSFSLESPTRNRNTYYAMIFSEIYKSAKEGSVLAGCNFWGWGGLAKPEPHNHDGHISYFWERGDDYCGDPAQEAQGLNSVFISDDSTIELIKNINSKVIQK